MKQEEMKKQLPRHPLTKLLETQGSPLLRPLRAKVTETGESQQCSVCVSVCVCVCVCVCVWCTEDTPEESGGLGSPPGSVTVPMGKSHSLSEPRF